MKTCARKGVLVTSAAQRALLVVVLLLLPFDWASQVDASATAEGTPQPEGVPRALGDAEPLSSLVPAPQPRPLRVPAPHSLAELSPPPGLTANPTARSTAAAAEATPIPQSAVPKPAQSDRPWAAEAPPGVAPGVAVAEVAEAAEPAPEVPPVRVAEPTRVLVPAVGASGPLVPVGLHPDRTLVVPDQAHVAGWYTGAPRPGVLGPAVIVGHNTWKGSNGVFLSLHRASVGDVVEVHHDDGSVVSFQVYRVEQHRKDAFPTQRVYGNTDRPELRVITCGGPFDRTQRRHLDNIVVFAHRI